MSPYLLEWFVVPLLMFLFLFWLRDNLNILHMPLADLVALCVIADVAIALNFTQVSALKWPIAIDWNRTGSPAYWWAFAVLGFALCVLLVYGIEKKIRRVAIHHISVGLWHNKSSLYQSPWVAYRARKWQTFTFRWSAGFAITAMYIAVQLIAVGIDPIEFAAPLIRVRSDNWLGEIVFLGLGTFMSFLVIGALLTLVGVFRYSEAPLPWTYLAEDQVT